MEIAFATMFFAIQVFGLVWQLATGVAIGGSAEPIERESRPAQFWFVVSLEAFLFLLYTLAVAVAYSSWIV
jgi:hypothetical protein